ncbi:MAG: glycine dehydrogenase, partial [Spirochaetes bacterium]|nr:glycine dehydrogenase [Spirochaetota bacterium]
MDYTALSENDREQMLRTIGVHTVDELFSDIPEFIRIKGLLNLPHPLSDVEVERHMRVLSEKNKLMKSFVGAGVYPHYIPAVVDEIAQRGEFYTAYTPYQPEVSQGTLTVIFEYQTMIARLTGMDIANASMYDGATATAEAILM